MGRECSQLTPKIAISKRQSIYQVEYKTNGAYAFVFGYLERAPGAENQKRRGPQQKTVDLFSRFLRVTR
jgi:hypothetical protein